jgi:hypothetical protein
MKLSSFLKSTFALLTVVLFFSGLAAVAEVDDKSSDSSGSVGRSLPHPDSEDSRILTRYFAAVEQQRTAMRGQAMEVDIDARIPKLQKEGKLHALRKISSVGKVTYRALGFSGDMSVKKDVIARYLTAEVQAQGSADDISITPNNYKFKYKGAQTFNGRKVYVFHLAPRKKRIGLFKGEVWIDADTSMPVQEAGLFVKSPSIFFRKLRFVRMYAMNDGVSVPSHIATTIDTRIVGPVQFDINFAKPSKFTGPDDAPGEGDE